MLMRFSPLDDIREQLKLLDQKIAVILGDFRAAANPETIAPTADLVSKVNLPSEVEDLAIKTNTPRELFSGVKLFLALTCKEDQIIASRKCDHEQNKTQEFIALCEELCKRHDLSRQVFEYKKERAEEFRGNNGKVITFILEQHDKVVARMWKNSVDLGNDGDLSANIIGWIAAINAGWQDMGINENKGPFVEPVTKAAVAHYEIRDPRSLKAA